MNILDYFRKSRKDQSASLAKERLQVIVAHERSMRSQPDYLPKMQREILDVIRKYVSIDQDQVSVHMDNIDNCSVLELNVTLPN